MTEKPSDKDPSSPVPKLNSGSGFTKREFAAILLRVPDSGLGWLDEMIRASYAPNQ